MSEILQNTYQMRLSLDSSRPISQIHYLDHPIVQDDFLFLYRDGDETPQDSEFELIIHSGEQYYYKNEGMVFPSDGYKVNHNGLSRYSLLVYPHLDTEILSIDDATKEEWELYLESIYHNYPKIRVWRDITRNTFGTSIVRGLGENQDERDFPKYGEEHQHRTDRSIFERVIVPHANSLGELRFGINVSGLVQIPTEATMRELDAKIVKFNADEVTFEFPEREEIKKSFSTSVEVFRL